MELGVVGIWDVKLCKLHEYFALFACLTCRPTGLNEDGVISHESPNGGTSM